MVHHTTNLVNLAATLRDEIAGDAIGSLATGIGAPLQSVRTAVEGLAVVLVAALANRTATPRGLDDLIDLMRTSGFDGGRRHLLPGRPAGSGALTDLATRGLPVTKTLLGGRRASVVDWLASTDGLGRRSAAALLALAAPFALHVVARQARLRGGLTGPVLADLLGGQMDLLREAAQRGVVAAGWRDLLVPDVGPGARRTHRPMPASPSWLRWPGRLLKCRWRASC